MTTSTPAAKVRKREPRNSKSRAYYYQAYRDDGNGFEFPLSPTGSPVGDWKGMKYCSNKHRVVRRRFKPLATEKRYRFFGIEWLPTFPGGPELDSLDFTVSKKERKRRDKLAGEMYRERRNLFGHPASLIDVPADSDILVDFHEEDSDKLDREGVLAEVSRRNRRNLKATEIDDIIGMWWFIAIELGCPLELSSVEYCIDENGVGHRELQVESPVRLLVPTKAELTKYGDIDFVAAVVEQSADFAKGGAA